MNSNTTTMTSTRPYLIRAFYDWIVDNNFTPHIVVNAEYAGVAVPRDYVENGQIILNISMNAVQGLTLGNQNILFQARFGGKIFNVLAPVSSVLAIYARENGRGMVFAEETDMTMSSDTGTGSESADSRENTSRETPSRKSSEPTLISGPSKSLVSTSGLSDSSGASGSSRSCTSKPSRSADSSRSASSATLFPVTKKTSKTQAPHSSSSPSLIPNKPKKEGKDKPEPHKEDDDGNGGGKGGKSGSGGRPHLTIVK